MTKARPLLEISRSLTELLTGAGVKIHLTEDQVVESIRQSLKRGMVPFLALVKKTFDGRLSRRKASILYRRFLRKNRLVLGDLVLSGQVEA